VSCCCRAPERFSWKDLMQDIRVPVWIAVALLLTATIARAATPVPSFSHEPELDREEARRLVGESPGLDDLALDRTSLDRGAQRKRLSDLSQVLQPTLPQRYSQRITAEGDIDLDLVDKIIYSPQRTQIVQDKFFLEADKVIFDTRLQEIQAEGNVILKIGEDPIYADSIRYNFDQSEGVAYNASGAHDPIYFQSANRRNAWPQLRKVSAEESIFRDTVVSTCDFKIPHYSVKGREIILFQKDRIFFRGATFYVWGVPTFYLPVYSRSLLESSPWSVSVGHGSRTGGRVRLSYTYHHRTQEPTFEDSDEFETRSAGQAQLYFDYLSSLGEGGGLDYRYAFEFDKHKGEFKLYGLRDHDREVVGARMSDMTLFDESDRWRWWVRHRTEVAKDLYLIFNIDEFSDPDIFYDVLDRFQDLDQRERPIMRRGRAALTWRHEALVVRLMAEIKDRVGLDRFNDFSDPRDDNRDFDFDPFRRLEKDDTDGISNDRWGRVGSKLPQIDIATRHLPLGNRPLYINTELHLYNSLDKGLNTVDDDDDAFVRGVEYYISLLHQWKLSQRYVIIYRLGFGLGAAERDDDLGFQFPPMGYPLMIDGLMFVDDDGTFLIGTRQRNLDDIKTFYVWGDSQVALHARFSDALKGLLRWRFRETTDDFIGDWYASLGSTTFREDLYDYKLREHWIEGELFYRLAHPLLNAYARGGYNLESHGDLYSKEPVGTFKTGMNWSNQRQTLLTGGHVGWDRYQIFDPSDPRQFLEDVLSAGANASYSPIHQRWYTLVRATWRKSLNGNTEMSGDHRLTFFTDEEPDLDLTWIYGRELGPKWDTELLARWDQEVGGLREVAWHLQRDMHDAVADLKISLKNDERDSDDRHDRSSNQLDLRLGVRLKLPESEVALGPGQVRTIKQQARQPAISH
jgi:hypothetical protein